MKRLAAGLIILLALTTTGAIADEEKDIDQAVAAALSWLSIVDAGKYGESWDGAATTFQGGITKPKWEQAVGKVRNAIGTLKSRILMKGKDGPKVAKLPAGEAIIIQFASSFDKLAPAIETVTPFREQDGTWRVSGYFVKPL